MNVPEEFRHLALRMHQDIFLDVESIDELVDHLIRPLIKPKQQVVKGFITELLATNPDPEDLVMLWAKAGADWYFDPRDIFAFLTMIRDRIE